MIKESDKESRKAIQEERRRKNIESAVRSRNRLKNEHQWMVIQMRENDDRIKKLERKLTELSDELTQSHSRPSKKSNSSQSDRPKWFGVPF